MLTRFGKFCRKLRIDNGELLYDMAQHLGVSPAFLSKVENGKSKPPIEWKDILVEKYNLESYQQEELIASIDEGRASAVINVKDMTLDDREMMFAFARKLSSMDENDKEKWKKMLKG